MKKNTRTTLNAGITALLALSLTAGSASLANAAPVAPETQRIALPMAANDANDYFSSRVVTLINKERSARGLKPLVWNQGVSNVSQSWAEHLGRETAKSTFKMENIHRTDAGGSLIPSGASWYGEIISFNFTPEATVNWWMNSPSHKAAMLYPSATDIGVGYTVPTSGPYAGWHQTVVNLATYRTTATTPATQTALRAKAIQVNGALGAATSGEVYGLKNGGAYQNYQKGAIVWSPTSGAHISFGGIRTLWANTGYERGGLGYPTSDEVVTVRGGVYQNYQGGAIIWHPSYGAKISFGGIRTAWLATGAERGGLGFPTSNEIGIRDGGVYQNYEKGSIIWHPKYGAKVSIGGIRGVWAKAGYENGRLGYPTSNEYVVAGGSVKQNYEGGVITWNPNGSTSIAYK